MPRSANPKRRRQVTYNKVRNIDQYEETRQTESPIVFGLLDELTVEMDEDGVQVVRTVDVFTDIDDVSACNHGVADHGDCIECLANGCRGGNGCRCG